MKGFPFVYQLPLGAAPYSENVMYIKGRSASKLQCQLCADDGSGSAKGIWLADHGEVRLRVNNGSSLAAGQHQVSMRFYNPIKMLRSACAQMNDGTPESRGCPSKVHLSLHVSYDYDKAIMSNGVAIDGGQLGVLGAGDAPSWVRTHVSESNHFAGVVSHLLIEVAATVEFAELTTFTLRGFPKRNHWFWGRVPQTVVALSGIEATDGNIQNCFNPLHVIWTSGDFHVMTLSSVNISVISVCGLDRS
jgi:hypothetical protein